MTIDPKVSRILQTHGTLAVVAVALAVVVRLAAADWPSFGRALCTAPGDQIGPAIASDGAGGAIVAWHDRRQFPFNIDVQHVLASGEVDAAWANDGQALLTGALVETIVPQGKEFPAIASDGAGGAIVTWPDARSTANGLDLYAQHILASGVVDPSWPVNGTTVCSVPREQTLPVIVADGAGGAFIAWADDRATTTGDNRDVFAQHLLASGLVDPRWPANGTPVCTAPKAQIVLGMVADGAGGFLVTWTDFRSGNPGSDIFADHVLATGIVDPAWPVDGFGVCTATGSQSGPRAVSDGGTGAIVTWTDTRDGTNEIFAERVLFTGVIAAGWPVNGRAVSIGGTDEVGPTLVADGAGGAIVAWGGGSSGHHNMRAQHVLGSGVLDGAWPAAGISLSFAPTEETNQVMSSDGGGGAIVAWQQGGPDIFAQHVLATGALDPTYPVNGRAVATLPSPESEPDIVATGPDGAIVTWIDGRAGNKDIYAIQVQAAGTVGVPPSRSPDLSLLPPRPNPARVSTTLRYALPRGAGVSLGIFDVTGRRVRSLVSEREAAGEHAVDWDLHDEQGRPVDAGVYFARLDVEHRTLARTLVKVR